jgi:hypothetical protein
MTATQGAYLLGVLCISALVFTMYHVMLARMEYYEHLKQMAEKLVDIK